MSLSPLAAWSAEQASAISSAHLAPSQASSLHDTHIEASAAMRSALIEEDFKQARTAGLGIEIDVDHRLAETLKAKLAVGANLDTGTYHSVYSDEYKPSQSLKLVDAHLSWQPLTDAELRLGAVNQKWMESDILVDSKTFPAAVQSWRGRMSSFFVQLSAEQAIPTSDTDRSMPRSNGELPFADFERASIGVELPKTALFQAHIGHFAFRNLTPAVAEESRYRGNDATGTGDASSFIYQFDGVETGARVEGHFTRRWRGKVDGLWLTNLRAPAEKSRGMKLSLETAYAVQPNLLVTPTAMWFRSERDSTPGYYNSSAIAHNNRQGIGAGMKLEFPKDRLEIEGSWVSSKVIQQNPFQHDFTGVVFSLRKSYDLL